ncbi:acyltransferase family protein [Paratractidigestivibacter sp.]|uniref:acyltransferase family protein n=1 Tax=Paratractidigestivibacter sp. TaxID=2847316 RepID=UPI002AC8B4C5|nr:acyltransferase family protein [Paratractidigestivibacter sp.]
MTQRIKAFDVAKSVALAAVIIGHTAIRFQSASASASKVVALALTFHLPLFFIVSGYFLHTDKPFDCRREARSLLRPYAIGAGAVVVGSCVSNLVLRDQGSTLQLFKDWLSAAVYGAGDIAGEGLAVWPQVYRIGGIWFLLALFWARLFTIFGFKTKAAPLVSVICFLLGWCSAKYIYLPFDIQCGLCAVPFVTLGAYARRYSLFDRGAMHPIVWVIFAGIWVWAFVGYEGFSMAMCGYGNTPLAFVRNVSGAVAGSFCVIGLCCALERGPVGKTGFWCLLARLGTITLVALCVHIFEDDVLRWGLIVDTMSRAPIQGSWALLAVARCVADFMVAYVISSAAPCFSGALGHLKAMRAVE